jgi:hypothetical protein
VTELLYKVSEPRDNWTFEPRRFWRTEDWSFSDDQEREGLIEDCVMYAARFDEVNMYLLPKVWRLRVWLDDEYRCERLRDLGFTWRADSRAIIFALEADRESIESFSPTVYAFDKSGFEQTPTDEFVSREPRIAISAETVPFDKARERWQFDLLFVADSDDLVQSLRSAGVDHQMEAYGEPFN